MHKPRMASATDPLIRPPQQPTPREESSSSNASTPAVSDPSPPPPTEGATIEGGTRPGMMNGSYGRPPSQVNVAGPENRPRSSPRGKPSRLFEEGGSPNRLCTSPFHSGSLVPLATAAAPRITGTWYSRPSTNRGSTSRSHHQHLQSRRPSEGPTCSLFT